MLLALAALALALPHAQAQRTESASPVPSTNAASTLQPRQFAAVAHDSTHRQSLLFGGTYGAERFSDTWLLGSSGWKQQASKANPGARVYSSAVYDSTHNQFVLFGGRVKQANPVMCSPGEAPQRLKNEFLCSDTWVFASGNWIKKTPHTSPSSREGHAMAFDATRKQIVLFGGTAGNNSTLLNDTWLWDGNSWKKVNPAHRPPARVWHSMAYDPVHRVVVLFGGDAGSQFLNDTWLWNGKDWQAAGTQATPPGLRTNGGFDYDPVTGKMVLFSGTAWTWRRNGSVALDSWSWDGTQWKNLGSSKFRVLTDFSQLTSQSLDHALIANSSPSYLWLPVK